MSTDTKNNVTVRRLFATLQGVMGKVKDLFKTGINGRPSSITYGYTHLGTINVNNSNKRGNIALDVYAGYQVSHLHCISATFGYRNETTIKAVYSAYAPTDGERGRYKLCYKFAEGHTADSPKIDVWLIDTKSSASSTRRCACVVHGVAGVAWTDGTQTSTTTLPANLVDFDTAYPYGELSVACGGTGRSTVTADRYLKGNGTNALVERTYAEVRSDLGISAGANKVEASSTNGNIKIDGAETTVYTHPTSAGSKHIPSGGSSGQFLGWDSAGTAKWVNSPNTDTKVKATSSSTDAEYKLLATASASPTSGSATESIYNTAVTINPSKKTIAADYCDSMKGIISRQISGSSATGLARLGQFVYSSGTSRIRAQATFRISATSLSKETRCEFLVRFAFQVNVTDGKITGFSSSDIYTYKKVKNASPEIHVYYTLTDTGVINVYVGPASATSSATFRYLWSVQSSVDMGVKFVVQNLGSDITTYPGGMIQVPELIEPHGTGGSDGTAIWINSSGEVKECTNLTAIRASYATSAGTAETADNALAVNGYKIVVGSYGGESNTIYFS